MFRRTILVVMLALASLPATAKVAEFQLENLGGEVHRLSDYRGKWVVVNYWAMWCMPCREEIPELIDFHARHRDDDAVVLGVTSTTADPARLKEFVAEQAINYPVLLISPETEPLVPLNGIPATILVDPEGQVVARKLGAVTADGLEEMIGRFD